MIQPEPHAVVCDSRSGVEVAHVTLDQSYIQGGVLPARHGRMRSFQLLDGDLRKHWYAYRPLTLTLADEQHAVYVAALPAKVGATGFFEFIDA